MSKTHISIIIPAYNEERYLGRCLDSIAAQAEPPHEVIVVDNNSTDATVAVAVRYPFVRVLHEPRQGRAFAQNTGFDAATGAVLARIDADAILPADWTARIAAYFALPGSRRTAWTGGALFYNVRLPRLVSNVYNWIAFSLNRVMAGHPSLWGSSMALPKPLWDDVSGRLCARPDLHEDLDLSIHLHRAGYGIVYDAHTRVNVELRPAYASAAQIWAYLQLWPRTLQIHNNWRWVLCWPVNIAAFAATPFFGLSQRIARLFGRPPL